MFSIKESFRYGWQKSKENIKLVLLATIIVLAVGAFAGEIGDRDSGQLGSSLLSLLVLIFLIIIEIGYKKIFLKIYDIENPKLSEIFQEYRVFWKYVGVSILTSLAVLGGLVLFIIPGIFWAVRFSFAPFIVIDTKSGSIVAMKESYAITKGSFWKILLFWITVGLLNIAGIIAFGLGLLITVPVTTLACVFIYRTLSKNKAGLVETPTVQVPQTTP